MTDFRTNPERLEDLLRDCAKGEIKLPEFQRSWVWDEERIRSLIASISLSFPVGALMTLETGGPVDFKHRPIQGAPDSANAERARYLLLDGQQRMTSLYQTCLRNQVVETVTARNKKVKRWFYIDIKAALSPDIDRESAIVGVPEDRIVRENFGKDIKLDLSTPAHEHEQEMFPVNKLFDWDEWQEGYGDYWIAQGQPDKRQVFRDFKDQVLQRFKSYQVPVIELARDTSREAVCTVFEKVNTGGKSLDAFELVTAMYASHGFELRKDWMGEGSTSGRYPRLATFGRAADQEHGLLEKVASTDFLQAIALRFSKLRRQEAAASGLEGRELPAVSATRQSLLNLPLAAYQEHANPIEEGFRTAAKFIRLQQVHRVIDLPYPSQLVPLAAIFAEIGNAWENGTVRERLVQWFWCGVFGELYGSASETRFARDISEVPAWVTGQGEIPTTIHDCQFRTDRLLRMRSRLSAAYKGVNALLMKTGSRDFRSGQPFNQTVFFDEAVDIHHIFPRDWCRKQGIPEAQFESIINKTPLTARTNRILGGVAPSTYLARLEKGAEESPAIAAGQIDECLSSHLIDPAHLRADDFDAFFEARRSALIDLIEKATGETAYQGAETNEPEMDADEEVDNLQVA